MFCKYLIDNKISELPKLHLFPRLKIIANILIALLLFSCSGATDGDVDFIISVDVVNNTPGLGDKYKLSLPYDDSNSTIATRRDVTLEVMVNKNNLKPLRISYVVVGPFGEKAGNDILLSPTSYVTIKDIEPGSYTVTLTSGSLGIDNEHTVNFEVTSFDYYLSDYWGEYGSELGQYMQPYGAALNNNQAHLFVTDCRQGLVIQTTIDGEFVKVIGNGFGSEPGQLRYDSDIAIDSNGVFWVVEERNNRISTFDADGNYLASYGSFGSGPGQFELPLGIALDSKDNVYVVDYGNNRVQKFTSDMTYIKEWGSDEYSNGDAVFAGPYYLDIDDNDNIFVVDRTVNKIRKYDNEGNILLVWGETGSADGQFNNPHEISIDRDGFVYVADTYNHRVQIFTNDGKFVAKFGDSSTLQTPKALVVDDNYNIYIADLSGAVAMISKWSRSIPGVEGNLPIPDSNTFLDTISDYNLFPSAPDFSNVNSQGLYYEPKWPLWTNGVTKHRLIYLPENATIDVSDRSRWIFPNGTKVFKTFFEDNANYPNGVRAIETRVFKKENDEWDYAAYQWNSENTDANLLDGLEAVSTPVVNEHGEVYDYLIPSKSQCRGCHVANKHVSSEIIGFEEIQLTKRRGRFSSNTYLNYFEGQGIFNQQIDTPHQTITEPYKEVKGYVKGNCVHCHNGGRAFDMSHTSFIENTINQPATSQLYSPGTIVIPGDAENSLLYNLIRTNQMPPLGVQVQDHEGTEAIAEWINNELNQ